MIGDELKVDGNVPGSQSRTVRLWDGRDYDREWLAKNYPELLAAAQQGNSLSETMPYTAASAFRRVLLMSILLCNGFFGSIISVGVWQKEGVAGVAAVLLGCTVLGAIAGLLQGSGYAAVMHRQRPSIHLESGQVEIFRGSATAASIPFECVEWFVGRVSDTNVIEKMWWPAAPAIVLAAPGGESEVRMAVGYTEGMRRVWTQFLVVNGSLRRTAWERSPWSLYRLLHVAAGVVVAAATVVISTSLALYAISLAGVDPKLADQLKYHSVMTSFLLTICYVGILWPWRGLRRAPPRSLGTDSRRPLLLMWLRCAVPFSFLAVAGPLLSGKQGPLTWPSMLVAGLWEIAVLAFAWDLARRYMTVEWQKTL